MKKTNLENIFLKGDLNFLPTTFLDHKDSRILSGVTGILRHWSDEDLYPSLLLSLLRLPKEFKKIRKIAHLRRVVCAEFFYKKKTIKAIDQYPQKRHLFVKLLKTTLNFPFGTKSALGIFVAFNHIKPREAFEEGHILEVVRQIIPDVNVVNGSFIDQQDQQNQVHTVYLEIEKGNGVRDFSLSEIKRLHKELPPEFKGCIEQLVPVTFMRRNEEEVYRNILALRDQLKAVKDLPQTTITFEEQTQFDLFFTVVLLRLIKSNPPTIQEVMEKQNPGVLLIPDRVDFVGTLRKKYRKEATVFRLQLPKHQFYRKDRSVNLYKARQQVFAMLTKALGPVRDYNGGLILKQNERLEDFLAIMPKEYDEFFLENFFYSITPIAMQSILPALLIKEWFLAFTELLEKAMRREDVYLLLCRSVEEAQLVLVRAEDRSFKEVLLREISHLGIPSLELAFAEINMHGAFCFGFLYRPSLVGKGRDFCKIVSDTLEKWSESVTQDQTIRIAVHGNDPILDPRISKGDQGYIILKMLFEGLTRIGPDGNPQLAMAESYEVSPDFKKYTFFLREAKWSNGAAITASDFEYSWKKALNPSAYSILSSTLYLIKNAKKAKENLVPLDSIGVKAVGDKTLVVELEYPAPYFLHVAAHWTYSLINSAIDQHYPDWACQAGENYVCNGPFKLVDWKHSRALTVEKNPSYWDAESVKLKKISISIVKNMQSDVGMLKRGDVDVIGRPMTPLPVDGFQYKSDEVEHVTFPLNGMFILSFNALQFPFNHKKIRQAFACAIDRRRIAALVAHEYGGAGYSLLPTKLSLHSDPLFPDFDVQKARALFFEGLGEIGFVKSDFPRINLTYFGGHRRLGLFQMLCQVWKEIFEIEIHLTQNEWNVHFDRLVSGAYQIGGIELNAWWSDPLHLLEFFESKADLLNIPFWEHAQYKKIMYLAKQASTIEERNLFLKQAESLLAEEIPAIPLYQLSGNYLKRKGLDDVFSSENFQIDFKWANRKT